VTQSLIHGMGGVDDACIRVHSAAWLPATTDLQVTIFANVLLPAALKSWKLHPGAFPETAYIQVDRGE
jgi:hypothetical protein